MKFRIKHPVYVNVKAARSDKVTKTPLTVTTTFDIPNAAPGDFTAALTLQSSRHRTPTSIYERDGRFFCLEGLAGALETGKENQLTVSGTDMKEVASAATYRLVTAMIDRVGPDRVISKRLFDQPDVNSLPADRVDWADFEAEMAQARRLVGNFAIIERKLYHTGPEPFYAIVRDISTTNLVISADAKIPEGTVALFRIGRLDEAREFGRLYAAYRAVNDFSNRGVFKDIDSLVESPDADGQMNDIGVTLAMTACKALANYRSFFNPEFRSRQYIDDLIFNVPFEELALVRQIEVITSSRGYHDLSGEVDQLAELVERAAAFGPHSRFTGMERLPLQLIHEQWADREIDLEPTRKPTP